MKHTCFLAAILIWASAVLLFPMPGHADLAEMSDQDLDGITGQSGSVLFAEGSAGSESLPRRVDLFGIFLQDWIIDSMAAGETGSNAFRMDRGAVDGIADNSGNYDFRAQFSGNVHIYTPSD